MSRLGKESLDRGSFLWVATAAVVSLMPVLPGFPLWLSVLLLVTAALGIGLHLRGVILPPLLRLPFILFMAVAAVAGSGFSASQETGAALLATMLATKLLETRTVRDGRSICSFSLFAIMAGFLRDQGPLMLLQALVACLLLVAALAQLARLQLPGPPPAPKRRQILVSSVRLLAISLPFAAVVYLGFPRFPEPLWGSPGAEESGRSGLSDQVSPGDIAEMLLDDSPALRVSFETDTPPRNAMYWRGPVLGNFDGRSWSRWRGSIFAPPAPMQATDQVYVHEVMQEPTRFQYLIALDLPVEAPEQARMGADHTLYATRPSQSVRQFRVSSSIDAVLQPDLPDTTRQHYLSLPPGTNPRTLALMAQWQAENAHPETLIQRALDWFHAEFVYSLVPPPLARDSVDDFLFGTKEGYCEHFASSFAVMMRSAGIPARVITGYQGGFYNPVGKYWLIRNSDAHAWTEVWLEARGWVRIDPTAAVAPERIREGLPSLMPAPGMLSHWGQPLWNTLDALRRGWNFAIVDFDARRQRDLFARLGLDPQDWRQIALILGLGIALALAISFGLLWRGDRRQKHDPLQVAWNRFLARLTQAGISKRPDQPASALLTQLASIPPPQAEPARLLILRYISQRYAASIPTSSTPAADTALIADLRRFRFRTVRKNP